MCGEAKKWPPWPTSAIASTASEMSSTSIGCRYAAIICNISASMISFSKLAVSPPSSQPAAWLTRLAPPITAPHNAIELS